MRITAGIHRARNLHSPKGMNTRPTSDRTRESIFNILRHHSWDTGALQDATVLDIFAGTGALGLEALSQGAEHTVFIEKNKNAAKTCRENIEQLHEEDRTKLFIIDALTPMQRPSSIEPRSLIFLDPPYGKDLASSALTAFANKKWFKNKALCIVEMSKKEPETIPENFTLCDERIYGISKVQFLIWEDPRLKNEEE